MEKPETSPKTPVEPSRTSNPPEPSLDGATLLNDLQRTRADFENFRKNVEKDKEIETKLGTEFNPELHEAVLFSDSEGEKEVIEETLRPGYKYEGEVLRAAMVKVKRI